MLRSKAAVKILRDELRDARAKHAHLLADLLFECEYTGCPVGKVRVQIDEARFTMTDRLTCPNCDRLLQLHHFTVHSQR